ncbi:hypothetical protein HED60_20375 [Planctomycetales bacterium ZRK34]|nr:hypothetical protein HED60_20375 [Planctomycetales bacterium ZRK34]
MSESAESSAVNKLLPIIAVVIILGGLVAFLFMGLFVARTSTMVSGGSSISSGSASSSAGEMGYRGYADRWVVLRRDLAGKPLAVVIGLDSQLSNHTVEEITITHNDGSTEIVPIDGSDFLSVIDSTGATAIKNPLTDEQLADIIQQVLDGTRNIDAELLKARDAADAEAMIKKW